MSGANERHQASNSPFIHCHTNFGGRDTSHRVGSQHPQIGRHGQLETSTERRAVECGDHRDRRRFDLLQGRDETVKELTVIYRARQIGTGAEHRPPPGQHDRARPHLDCTSKGLGQSGDHFFVQRVALRLARQLDGRYSVCE